MNRLARTVLGGMVVTIGLAVGTAQANIVTNGSFEDGTGIGGAPVGWTQTGNTGFTGVECPGVGFAGPGDGACDYFTGPVGSNGTLSQVLTTIPGRFYNINFDFQPDCSPPNNCTPGGPLTSFFSATFGALPALFSVTNPPASPYQVLHFVALATAASTTLAFNFRDDPGFLKLDSVNVALPEPGTMALLAIGMTGLLLRRRKAL